MIRTPFLVLPLLLTACATPDEAVTPEVQGDVALGDQLVGTWSFDQTEVAFMEESDAFVTVPTVVYPDSWTEVHYLDGERSIWVMFQGLLTLDEDGTLQSYIDVAVDEDGDGVREAGQGADGEEAGGTWWTGEGTLVLEHDDFHVESFVEVLGADELYLEWNRDDPEFLSDSCVLSINASRVD